MQLDAAKRQFEEAARELRGDVSSDQERT